MSFFHLRDVFLILFNLLPLALVLDGVWRPFDVLAFYWLELAVIGFFALLALIIKSLYGLTHGAAGKAAGDALAAVFFPLHFGFFLVILCFPVGSFLPPETPAQPLTNPLVPLVVVIDNMPFFTMLPVVMAWQFFVFIAEYIHPRRYVLSHPQILDRAYKNLFVFFISAFFGVLIGMKTGTPVWGAVILCLLKTLCAYAATKNDAAAEPVAQ
jgi:hypothetical protein